MLRLDWDDAAIMTSGGNLRRRLIRDGREGQQIRLARALPVRPQAGDEHVLSGLRLELHAHVFLQFGFPELSPFKSMSFHVFIEHIPDDKAVRIPQKALPAALQDIDT